MSSPITISGHTHLRPGKRGGVWYAKWRDATGQHEKRLGKDWSASGRPAPGFLREKDAQAALDAILVDARRGAAAQGRTGVTFKDLAEEWYSSGKLKRDWSPGTQRDYRSVLDYHLIANFGALRIESISSARIERWRDERVRDHDLSRRLANKLLAILHGIFEYAVRKHGLLRNPVKDVEKLRESYDAARFDFYSPEEVRELVAKAGDSQDGVLYLTAAFSGLRRGELIGLLWEDVDFENHSIRVWETVTLRERGLPEVTQVAHRPDGRRRGRRPERLEGPGAIHPAQGPRVRRRGRRADRRLGAAPSLHRRSRACRAALPPLPRPAPHIRVAGDQLGVDRPGSGVDGPRRHQDDDALPAPQEPRRRRTPAVQRLPARERGA